MLMSSAESKLGHEPYQGEKTKECLKRVRKYTANKNQNHVTKEVRTCQLLGRERGCSVLAHGKSMYRSKMTEKATCASRGTNERRKSVDTDQRHASSASTTETSGSSEATDCEQYKKIGAETSSASAIGSTQPQRLQRHLPRL